MDHLARLRTQLAGPEVRTTNADRLWITASAVMIVGLGAFWSEGRSLREVLLLLPAIAAFALRGFVPRLYPEVFALAVLLSVGLAVSQRGNFEGAFFLVTLVPLYACWYLGPSARSVMILATAVATPRLVAASLAPVEIGWEAWSAASLFTFGLGAGLRKQDTVIAELQAARQALAEQAVAEERRRIARELHDLAGHTLAAVLLHVTGARHVLRRDLDEAERALLDAETLGRSSLDQIRATVAALRTDERGTDPALAGSADLGDLVDEYRRAGLQIELDLAPAVGAIEGPAGTALHRIVRESLANVARHAATNRVRITINREGDVVRLAVTDRGRPATQPDPSAGHFGLVGMRERARSLGGELDAGPTADGWTVTADLHAPVGRDELLSS